MWLCRQLETQIRVADELSPQAQTALRHDLEHALMADREVRSMLASLLRSLSAVARVVNRPEAAGLHERKPLLTARLRRADLPVPESLTTTDLAAAKAFFDTHRGQAVAKAAAGGGEALLATELLEQLPPEATALSGPMLFQRRILGTSLRAYVVGDRLVSCQEVIHGDVVDWRTDQQGLRPHRPDRGLVQILVQACEAVGLDYAGIDAELDGQGAPFLLDVNPAPLFASYERVSGDEVAGPLAELLIEEARAA